MNISDLYGRLQEDCGFIAVDSYTTGDNYGAMTIVQLTDEQIQIWNHLQDYEIKNYLAKSENIWKLGLRQPYFLKSPVVQAQGRNEVCVYGGRDVAAIFFREIFQKNG